MIDRGDLSTETNIETLGVNQKRIIKAASVYLSLCSSNEMLDNMIKNPQPIKLRS